MNTVGSIICKFRATRTVATRHGRGRKKKTSATSGTFMRRQVDKNPKMTSKDLKEDLANVGADVSVDKICHTLHAAGVRDRTQ